MQKGARSRTQKGGGTIVNVAYTPASCATDHAIYWGQSPIAGSLSWMDSECARGTDGTTDFNPGDPAAGGFYYFVIVGDNGTNDGSYGKDSSPVERPAASGPVQCHAQQLVGACP
jgi:hypothetical protein